MLTTVYLIRHGRTALNAAGVLRGRIDEPLDSTGRTEALRLASLFESVRLTRVVASPLKRSFETARLLAQPHGLTVMADPAFIDRDYGPWAGLPQQALIDRYGSVDTAPSGEVEPRAEFERRITTALKRVAREAHGKIVAIVAHDAVNRALIHAAGRRQRTDMDLPQPTGCWNRFVCDGQTSTCEVVGAVPGDGVER
jgi:broad specificity phosphatase PhoE